MPFAPAFAFLAFVPPGAAPQSLAPRDPPPKTAVRALALPPSARPLAPELHRLVVKFVDAALARSTAAGGLVSLAGADLAGASAIAQASSVTFEPLIRLPESALSDLEGRAAARSGVAQPDLAGMLVVRAPGATPAALESIGEALQRLPIVEAAWIETLGTPPPGDVAPPTPSLSSFQTYHGPNPGMNVTFAWSLGLRGAGMRLSDCEYAWNASHEDLIDVNTHPEPGQTINPGVDDATKQHGTAVLGETTSPVNGYGCNGIAPDATVATFPEWTVEEGFRRVTAITHAIAGSATGDVVLLEMQTVGAGGDYGPAELDTGVYNVVKTGVAAGVVVVGAAGNGNQDLDSAPYAPYMAKPDSGAILVGAGSPSTAHSKLSFSTYGARVNVQGWGQSVFSIGYGDFAQYGGDPNQRYTSSFSGTSSASPFVAAACAILQQRAKQMLGAPLHPTTLRQVLIQTGVAQGSGGHIGPLPNLASAIPVVAICPVVTQQPSGGSYCGGSPVSLAVGAVNASSYQWRKNGVPIAGATSSTYAIAAMSPADAGSYDVVVTNAPYSATSKSVQLTVPPPAGTPFGVGTPGCAGPQTLTAAGCGTLGESGFEIHCDAAPPVSLGLLLVGDTLDFFGTDPFGLGVLLHVNVFTSQILVGLNAVSDVTGLGVAPLPVPNDPALVGLVLYGQELWSWGSACSLPPFGLSSSRGLLIQFHP